MKKNIFEDLFVLEFANNHWGDVPRGLKIIKEYSKIARENNVKAAIKLQLRDVGSFIHKEFTCKNDIRYIKKTIDTYLDEKSYYQFILAIRDSGCIPMATPFDEKSVELCYKWGLPIIKIASSDINDWFLLESIAKLNKPVIVSTGGSLLKDIDDTVGFFDMHNIPIAINHCISLYPTEDNQLELNQIDFLKARYKNHAIGLSTHEYHDWTSSIMIAYAKGVKTFERHIDIDLGDYPISKYCSLPHQIDSWFKAYKKAKEMCGTSSEFRRNIPDEEVIYLDALVRGAYALKDLTKGDILSDKDFYLAVPLQKGQLSCRENLILTSGVIKKNIAKDSPIKLVDIDSPYKETLNFKHLINRRGL